MMKKKKNKREEKYTLDRSIPNPFYKLVVSLPECPLPFFLLRPAGQEAPRKEDANGGELLCVVEIFDTTRIGSTSSNPWLAVVGMINKW